MIRQEIISTAKFKVAVAGIIKCAALDGSAARPGRRSAYEGTLVTTVLEKGEGWQEQQVVVLTIVKILLQRDQ